MQYSIAGVGTAQHSIAYRMSCDATQEWACAIPYACKSAQDMFGGQPAPYPCCGVGRNWCSWHSIAWHGMA